MNEAVELDLRLREFARSDRQREMFDAVVAHGSARAAARALKTDFSSLARTMRQIKQAAAEQGHSPEHDMTHTVPDGFKVRGVSTYYDSEGKPRGQWVKSSADDLRRAEAMRAAFEAMSAELPRLDPIEPSGPHLDHLCNQYTITDAHVGMLAWGRESGAPWDLRIAERTLIGCFEHMVAAAPRARTAIVCQLGDFMHYDGLVPITPTSGHHLDSDGRFSKMVAVSIRVLRRMIDVALMRHEQVRVVMAEGNHDIASSVWLRQMFAALYENEPRVTIDDSELPYYVYQHGQTMLAFHHGHLKKKPQLPILFASQFPAIWGATTKRYASTGHEHHMDEKEHSGMTVIQHPTLAARDAYAARGGWIAERAATALSFHDQFGLVARNTVTPEMLN